MDQIRPEEISRIVIAPPPFPGARHLRGWSVRVWRREYEERPDESYVCTDAERALNVARKLLAGEKVGLLDSVRPPKDGLSETGGRPHAAR